MKKLTFILALLMATTLAKAQDIVTEFCHENGKYFNFHNIVEASENTLIAQCPLFETFYGTDLGVVFYKVSMEGQLIDSAFFALDNVPLRTLFEPVPNESGSYLYARFEQDKNDSITCIKMTFIDDDLNICNEINIVIEDFLYDYIITTSDLFIDADNDIIASYWCSQKFYMLRIGLDGTIKNRREVESISASLMIHERHTGMYDKSSPKYYYIGRDIGGSQANSIMAYVIDTSFQVVESHRYYIYQNGCFSGGFHEHIIPFDDETYLLSSRFAIFQGGEMAACLAKFDKTHGVKAMQLFREGTDSPSPIWTAALSDGTVYYSYMTDAGYNNRLVLVCLDENLNIKWKRYFLEPDMFHWATCMTVLHDGKVAIGSYKYMENPGSISVVVIQDDGWNTPEMETPIRPYTYWPNPAQDHLHLQFSPDVTPKQIELYDLQGRLVRMQKNGLERLEMNGLPSGTYTMRVTMKDGKVFTDKVVKE
jgi:outer membrane protein assembly factor BamB